MSRQRLMQQILNKSCSNAPSMIYLKRLTITLSCNIIFFRQTMIIVRLLWLFITIKALPIEIPWLSSVFRAFKSCKLEARCMNTVESTASDLMELSTMESASVEKTSHLVKDSLIDEFFPAHLQALKVLGQGSFGRTFLVKDLNSNEIFALKAYGVRKDVTPVVPAPKITKGATNNVKSNLAKLKYDGVRFKTTPEMVEREWTFINHPVVDLGKGPIIEIGEKRYLPMKYIEGKNWLHYYSRWKDRFKNSMIEKNIRSEIERLHEAGIIHQDLAPRNIIIDKSGKPVIIDFGKAKFSNLQRDKDSDWAKFEMELKLLHFYERNSL